MLQKFRKRYHMANLIRQAVNTCPEGICMAETDGRPILTNRSMNDLSVLLTGQTVLNAVSLWEMLKQQAEAQPGEDRADTGGGGFLLLRLSDGTVWQFRRQELPLEEGSIWQYEASEVTALYAYKERLRENNLQTEKFHDRQRELIRGIVRNNREKERLQAKMRIHDNMGRILLMTKQAMEKKDPEAGTELFSVWEDAVEDLMNAAKDRGRAISLPEQELIRVAAMIGCRVHFSGRQPSEEKALRLLYAAVREALTNAVRHAGADEIVVEIHEMPDLYRVTIRDNGSKEQKRPLQEGGGLHTLRRRLEAEGASLRLEDSHGVVMHLEIPKEEIG